MPCFHRIHLIMLRLKGLPLALSIFSWLRVAVIWESIIDCAKDRTRSTMGCG